MEKGNIIVTARKAHHAIRGQWWQKSKSGKFWELGCEGPEKPTFLTGILAKRVLHVTPFEDEKEAEGTERAGLGGEREAREALRKAIQETPSPRIVIEMEGGLIHNITANVKAEVLILDTDTEGGDEDAIREVTHWNGRKEEVYSRGIDEPEVIPEYVDFYLNQFAQKE